MRSRRGLVRWYHFKWDGWGRWRRSADWIYMYYYARKFNRSFGRATTTQAKFSVRSPPVVFGEN